MKLIAYLRRNMKKQTNIWTGKIRPQSQRDFLHAEAKLVVSTVSIVMSHAAMHLVQHCCMNCVAVLWEISNFDPSKNQTPDSIESKPGIGLRHCVVRVSTPTRFGEDPPQIV